jgi:DNA invertase Pin-like site-specific DNA recombinase
MAAKPRKPAGRLLGYARVSTEEQGTDPQLDELRDRLRRRPAGARPRGDPRPAGAGAPLARDRPRETLVVVRLDRLARSVSHLLAVIEQLEAIGAHFRSLHDPIDATTPQGMFSLQVCSAPSRSSSGP